MPDEPGDLLDGDAALGEQGDEAVSELAWRPVFGGEPSGVPDPSEAASDVRCVQGCAGLGGEDEVVGELLTTRRDAARARSRLSPSRSTARSGVDRFSAV